MPDINFDSGWILTALGTGIGVSQIYPLLRKKIKVLRSDITTKFDKSNSRIIERYVLNFLETRKGLGYCYQQEPKTPSDQYLEVKIKDSFQKFRREKAMTQIENDLYYFYLFSLLENTTSKVIAISVSSPYEWSESEDERLFLNCNINASNRNIEVERIFVIDENEENEFLGKIAIQKQIIHSQLCHNYITSYVYEKNVPKELLKEISTGFLLFDNLVVAIDANKDEKDIEGTFQMVFLAKYTKIFNKLKLYSHPLNKEHFKEKMGIELNL